MYTIYKVYIYDMHLLNVCHGYHEKHFYIHMYNDTHIVVGEPSQCDGFGGQVLQKVGFPLEETKFAV